MKEPVLTWIHEEDIRQRMKTDPELSQDYSGEIVYQKEICNVSQALLQGKRAAEWLKQQQIFWDRNKGSDSTSGTEKTSGDADW